MKAFRYRIYPNKTQATMLNQHLRLCCNLYNEAKEIKEFVYQTSGKSFTYADLCALMSGEEKYKALYSQVVQSTLKRLERAFAAFFRRVKRGENPGYPRWKSVHRFDSFTHPQSGFKLNKRLFVSKIGHIKIRIHRPIQGKIKTLTLRKQCGKWYACFTCEVHNAILPKTGNSIGIDVGVTSIIATSNGIIIDNPKHFKNSESKINRLHKELSSKKPRSNNRNKARLALGKAYIKAKNQREDFYHKLTRKIINENDIIVVENLSITQMTQDTWKNLRKAINQTAWRSFAEKLSYKAEEAGRQVVKVNPEGTSSTCVKCGKYKKKELSERLHKCSCGLELDRDVHAAKNILRAGLALLLSEPRGD